MIKCILKFTALNPKINNKEKEKLIYFAMIFLTFVDDIRDHSSYFIALFSFY